MVFGNVAPKPRVTVTASWNDGHPTNEVASGRESEPMTHYQLRPYYVATSSKILIPRVRATRLSEGG